MLLSGCGGGGIHDPRLSALPLAPGVRIVTNVRRCDHGTNPYCALQMVAVGPKYGSSRQLMTAERNVLHAHGWSGTDPSTGEEFADDSPGHKLRVTYSTPYGDLKGIDLDWIERAPQIGRSLALALFHGTPAISIELQSGSQ